MTIHVPPQLPNRDPPRIAFVAEAPSTEEVEHGKPLVGPSGRVFNAILRTAKMDRAEFLITNVFDEKLPDNDVSNWCVPLRDARAMGITDIPPIGSAGFLSLDHRHHLDRLRTEMERWKPNVIVPLGGTALWAFTGQTGISALRGGVTAATRVVPGAKLLPTFHPAFVIHTWKVYSVVVADLLKAQREADRGPGIVYPKRRLILEPDFADMERILPSLLLSELLSVDIETGWGQITCIGFAPDNENAICIPFLDKRVPGRSYWEYPHQEREAWDYVRGILEDGRVPKLGQNYGGYDSFWLLKKKGIGTRNFRHDTRLMHHALYPELPKDLGFLGASYTDQGPWKHWGKKTAKRED